MTRQLYDIYECDGLIIKGTSCIDVPVNRSIAPHYPLPSECNKWIKVFENLRDNFTDDEIDTLNTYLWKEANNGNIIEVPKIDG